MIQESDHEFSAMELLHERQIDQDQRLSRNWMIFIGSTTLWQCFVININWKQLHFM